MGWEGERGWSARDFFDVVIVVVVGGGGAGVREGREDAVVDEVGEFFETGFEDFVADFGEGELVGQR